MSSRKKSIKVVVIGDSFVGKTSLMQQYISGKFLPQYKATIGADFMTRDMNIDGKIISLQIWDTAGQERFQTLGVPFYKGSDACVLVYDITNLKSFERLSIWKENFFEQGTPHDTANFPFFVLANKADKESERVVSIEKGMKWCKDNGGLPFYEVSAKEATKVKEAFDLIAEKSLKYNEISTAILEGTPYNGGKKLILNPNPPNENKPCSC
jgi:Ras-related protein Rab-7A